ncbi:noncompact myelin-associated protein isoform X1 [Saccopteryx leptura]|uniref:noncompact myelin-associated protein isoform X1 n=2 Tax=Saccopteryx leptura TaxID=249018 RepID=UPI00339C85B8
MHWNSAWLPVSPEHLQQREGQPWAQTLRKKEEQRAHRKGPALELGRVTQEVILKRSPCPRRLHYWIEMTTATPLGDTTFYSLNVTTREEDFLYKSSGAIVAAIVVVVIIIFTVVLILLKMYNRKMRARRELEPKGPKPASPSAQGPNSSSSQHPATLTFSPVDVHVETR